MPSAEPAVQAREVYQARDGCGCYSGYSEDTAIDNVSSPEAKAYGVYSEDTQIRTPDNGGYASACRLASQLYSAVLPVPETVMAHLVLNAGQGLLCSWRTPSSGCRGGSLHSRLGGGSAMGAGAAVERHDGAPPGEDEIAARMRAEGLSPHGWGNAPGDTYGWHEHGYEKVLYCVRGRIVFHTAGGDLELGPGDK